MTIKNILHWGQQALIGSDSARLDAELLLSHVLKKERSYLLAYDEIKLSLLEMRQFRYLVKKRKMGLPLAYILGKKEFYGLDFKVNKHVLIPRPDTEILVESAISYLQPGDLLLDVGAGSGCIPISILKNKKGLKAVATDISKKALLVAQENAKTHRVGDRIQFFNSDLLEAISPKLFKNRTVVVTANLPYVPLNHAVNKEAQFEPALALFAENNGLGLYQKLFQQLEDIKPKAIFLECYEFQIPALREQMKNYQLVEVKNMLGEARMLHLEMN